MNSEIYWLGYFFAVLGGWTVFIGCLLAVLRLTWFAFTEAIGWPRILRALSLLHEKEQEPK